jgi:glycosyltransferase involved in cell wall biosynthesis
MKIGVDGYEACAPDRVGVGRFVVEILRAIHKIDINNSYTIFSPFPKISSLPSSTENWNYRICTFNRLWTNIALPYYIKKWGRNFDLFFSPVHYVPRFISIPTVVGIMDLSFYEYPELFKQADLYKLKHWTGHAVRHASHVIAISESTKNDILSIYKCRPEKVSVVYPGASHMQSAKTNTTSFEELKNKFGINGTYILYVGTIQPRKNIERLIDAYLKVSDKELQLVIVGKKGWLYDSIFEKVKELKLKDRIIFTDYINSAELELLYKNAECFVLVSLYEGFGFPVLEAMQAGVPVVTSNVSSLPEVAGDAAELVDPTNTDEITRAIEKVLNLDKEERILRIEKGKAQAEKFTWEKTARETLKVFEKVNGKNKN